MSDLKLEKQLRDLQKKDIGKLSAVESFLYDIDGQGPHAKPLDVDKTRIADATTEESVKNLAKEYGYKFEMEEWREETKNLKKLVSLRKQQWDAIQNTEGFKGAFKTADYIFAGLKLFDSNLMT